MTYVVGVDIGGTNTDAVVLDAEGNCLAKHKEITTKPLEIGAYNALVAVCTKANISKNQIEAIFFGTTHATNALLEAKELSSVGHIRISGQRPDTSCCFSWPERLKKPVLKKVITIDGGFECDGRSITPFDKSQAECAVKHLIEQNVSAISVISSFSSVDAEHEERVQEIACRLTKDSLPVFCSKDIGGVGFIPRENATIVNACLHEVISNAFSDLETKLKSKHFTSPLYMVQNNASIMDLALAKKMPILTVSAGQTNSFIGASRLACLDEAIVVDIGGTSIDIGVVTSGMPRRSCRQASIGGISLQFSMPDVLSLAIGGGSIISDDNAIGPESVSRNIYDKALCFGGNTLTLTDVGIFLGILHIEGASASHISLSKERAAAIMHTLKIRLVQAITMVLGKKKRLPIIVVGGAASLVRHALCGSSFENDVVAPEHASVANAIGACLAEISATTTTAASLKENRQSLIESLKEKTLADCVLKGADPNLVRIADISILPYAYSQEMQAKIAITASGPRRKLSPLTVSRG